jgi:predicted nucleic acid-binding protein
MEPVTVMRSVLDTNILVDYLSGIPEAADEIARYKEPIISRITWMEVLIGASGDEESRATREFLRLFRIEELGEAIAEEAVRVRQDKRLRLPDAIIYATASLLGCQLVTRNVKDFSHTDPLVRVPYSVSPLKR